MLHSLPVCCDDTARSRVSCIFQTEAETKPADLPSSCLLDVQVLDRPVVSVHVQEMAPSSSFIFSLLVSLVRRSSSDGLCLSVCVCAPLAETFLSMILCSSNWQIGVTSDTDWRLKLNYITRQTN